MSTLALIPARSGSKGIRNKNARDFAGKPLMAWAIEIGLQTCDRTFVSTNDVRYGVLAAQYGAGIIVRPGELARDETPMLPVVQHALKELRPWEPDVVVLLQPTQPLRKAEHVRQALEALGQSERAESVVSVVEVPAHYAPDYCMRVTLDGRLEPFMRDGFSYTRRQSARAAWSRDGSVYAIRRSTIEAGTLYGDDCRPLIIPRSESVNLDSEEDWTLAETLKRGA